MSKKLRKQSSNIKREVAKSWRIALESEMTFLNYFVRAADAHKIRCTKKQYETAKNILKNGISYKHTQLLHNTGATTSKANSILTARISHSPLRAQNDASLRARKNLALAQTIFKLAEYEHVSDMHAYMITYTLPNASLHCLKDRLKHADRVNQQRRDAFKHAAQRKQGLLLYDRNGNMSNFLGDHIATEITINEKSLRTKNTHNLYHVHEHQVVLFDRALDLDTLVTVTQDDISNLTQKSAVMSVTKATLLKWWAKHNQNYDISANAFDIRAVYNNNNNRVKSRNAIISAFAEANKYAIKPNLFKFLKQNMTDFSLNVFSELMNAIDKKTMHKNHALVYRAQSFINFCTHVKLDSAVFNAHYRNLFMRENVTDFYTKTSILDVSNNKSALKYTRKLTAEQILFFNRDILSRSGFDSALLDQVKFNDSEKSKRFEYLLKSLVFQQKSKKGLVERLNTYENLLLSDDNIAHSDILKNKLADVRTVKHAVATLVDNNGTVRYTTNWYNRSKLFNVLETMKSLEKKYNERWSDVKDAKAHSEMETDLLDLYSREFFNVAEDSNFVSESLIELYLKTSHFSTQQLLDLLYNTYEHTHVNHDMHVLIRLIHLTIDERTTREMYTDCKIDTVEQLQRAIDKI